jgi:anti-sigma regulatory factor (Ser/Thr protein kinase)
LHFVIDNDPTYIAPIIGYLNDIIELQRLYDATERMRIGVALQEACLNAIYHGNLEVSSDLRQQDETIYHQTVKTRRSQDPYQDRRVHMDIHITPTEATYTVRDEGQGFDPSTLGDPGDATNLERIGGRGLLLIRTFMDFVGYNDKGNAITMVKRRDG